MSEWKKVKLGEISQTIQTGPFGSQLHQSDYSVIGIPVVMPKDIIAGNIEEASIARVEQHHIDRLSRHMISYGDILYARRGDVGKCAFTKQNQEGWLCGTGCLRVTINPDMANPKFVFFQLQKQETIGWITNHAIGSTMLNLNTTILSNAPVEIPSLRIQNRIVEILSRYDSLIENYQKQIKLLEEAAQRLYKEWFVDLHFPGHENTKIVDGVPEGWEKKKISDICQTVGGGTPSTKVAEYYDDGNIKWVTPTDITRSNCLCLFDTDKKITEDGLAHSSAKILPPETILMTSRASVGYFGIYDCEVCTNQGFISCIPNERSYQMYMLYNLMNRVEEIRQKAGGSTYLEISKSVFRDFDIVLPSCMVLETFQEQSHKMLDCMRQIAKQLRLLTEARDRLLPKLMSGEITV